ncbi:hypothetical protein SB2_06990 [Methylobacterium radiotolerans]|nr:hypothetical protein SB3_09035 [Methylobacterium radiotolerans]KTS49286.1 hypothetical protein SB2_06990 [Methylobacterium radiotolerans]
MSYARFSHKRQQTGTSIERQEETLSAYLKDNPDLVVMGDFSDKGVSGFRGKHAEKGALSRLLELLEGDRWPHPRVLVIENVDRLGREPLLDALDRFQRLIRAGVMVVVCDMNRLELDRESLNREPWRLDMVIHAMRRAHDESKRKSELVAAAWKFRIRKAVQSGAAVKGYVGPPWVSVDPVTKAYGIITAQDRAAADTVRQIFDWRATGLSVHGICKRLNAAGTPFFRANTAPGQVRQGFHQPYISELLKNRQVLGEHAFKAGEVIQSYFPAVVTPELFHRVQQSDTARDHTRGRKGAELSNLFTGMAKCSHCGGSMQMGRNRAGPNATKFLFCSQSKRRFQCASGGKFVNYRHLEKAVLDHLPSIPWIDIVRAETPDDPRPAMDHAIAEVEIAMAETKAIRDRAQDLVLRGHEEPFLATVVEKTAELKAMTARHETLVADRQAADQEWSNRPGLLSTAIECRDAMESLDPVERFNARTRLAEALRQIIGDFACDAPGKTVRLKIGLTFSMVFVMQFRKPPVVVAEIVGADGRAMRVPMPTRGEAGHRWLANQVVERSQMMSEAELALA